MMKNVNSLLLIFFLLLLSHLYSETKLIQISSPPASIKKHQSLIIDFQLTAQYLNPVDVNDIGTDVFIKHSQEKNMMLPAFCYQQIFNISKWQPRFVPTQQSQYFYRNQLKTQKHTGFSKTFSLNGTSSNVVNVTNDHNQRY